MIQFTIKNIKYVYLNYYNKLVLNKNIQNFKSVGVNKNINVISKKKKALIQLL